MSLKLLWVTDPHLDKIFSPRAFGECLAQENPEASAVFVSGDVSEAPLFRQHLEEFRAGVQIPVWFVLGNHDYYRGSFAEGNKEAASIEGWLHKGPIKLTGKVSVVGHEGWYGATPGNPFVLIMSDWLLIQEYAQLNPGLRLSEYVHRLERSRPLKEAVIRVSRDRSVQCADEAKGLLLQAAIEAEVVLFVTHVPPFPEAAWHEGAQSDSIHLPWFCSKHMGDALLEVATTFPDRRFIVFCGHTHSSGLCSPAPNVKVFTGQAVYGAPDLAGIIDIEESRVSVQLRTGSRMVTFDA